MRQHEHSRNKFMNKHQQSRKSLSRSTRLKSNVVAPKHNPNNDSVLFGFLDENNHPVRNEIKGSKIGESEMEEVST